MSSISTLIARYGDLGPEYKSGMEMAKYDLELSEAYKRYRDLDL